MNKYEENLINRASALDAVSQGKGMITAKAKEIIFDDNDQSAIWLCNKVSTLEGSTDIRLSKIALALKNSLIIYYGYKRFETLNNFTEERDPEANKTLDTLLDELNNLVGLEEVKSKVNDLIAYHKIQQIRKKRGLPNPQKTLHMAFMGNPGTGKTTVARIVGHMYKKLGLLSRGHFIEVSRTDLIAGYQGQTALKVKNVINKAKGGVLFIDEAYSITENDHSDSYGRECLTELTKALEDYRNDLVVIVAGYTDLMNKFFESNPGLKSRFNTFIEFPNYNSTELYDILDKMCKTDDYFISIECRHVLKDYFETIPVSIIS